MQDLVPYLGPFSVTIMVGAYALEDWHPSFILIFAFGCAMAAFYAWLIGSIPFVIAEGLWSIIACRRWYRQRTKKS